MSSIGKSYTKKGYQNNLQGTKTYLAGNLENCKDEFTWRDKVTKALNSFGINCLSPTEECFTDGPSESREERQKLKDAVNKKDYDYVFPYMKQVVRRDLRMCDLADFGIFQIDSSKPTFGTTHELIVMKSQYKPILCHVKGRLPLWLCGILRPENLFDSIDDIIEHVKSIHLGDTKADWKEWKLLREEYK